MSQNLPRFNRNSLLIAITLKYRKQVNVWVTCALFQLKIWVKLRVRFRTFLWFRNSSSRQFSTSALFAHYASPGKGFGYGFETIWPRFEIIGLRACDYGRQRLYQSIPAFLVNQYRIDHDLNVLVDQEMTQPCYEMIWSRLVKRSWFHCVTVGQQRGIVDIHDFHN